MTRKAKKRRQKKRKLSRKAGEATIAPPTPGAVTHWVSDHLPDAWRASVEAALAHLSAQTGRVYGRSGEGERRCEHVAATTDRIALCLTARANLATADRVAEARPGMVVIWDGYPPNPGVIVHEMKHLITGDVDHKGDDWDGITDYAG